MARKSNTKWRSILKNNSEPLVMRLIKKDGTTQIIVCTVTFPLDCTSRFLSLLVISLNHSNGDTPFPKTVCRPPIQSHNFYDHRIVRSPPPWSSMDAGERRQSETAVAPWRRKSRNRVAATTTMTLPRSHTFRPELQRTTNSSATSNTARRAGSPDAVRFGPTFNARAVEDAGRTS